MNTKKKKMLKLRSNMSIGSLAAESDTKFLSNCFIDNGVYEALQDFDTTKCILLGRTGAGKSAALLNLKYAGGDIIEIEPQALALNYISNSDVLKFFTKLGVDLDLFYNVLWKHVICVELLKYHFKLRSESDVTRFKDWLSSHIVKNKAREVAIKYLEKWNSKFWAETEERIKEITEKLEKQLTIGADLEVYGVKASLATADSLSKEVISEIVFKAQKVVNEIQIQDLSQVINLLHDEIFDDDQKRVFITIDSLDESWVDDVLRYKLIRGLIDATRKFRKIRNVKIIIALRTDLIERVYRFTRDAGFQEEKYEDLNIRIQWSPEQLRQIIDRRINWLFRDQYTTEKVGFSDAFPEKIRGDALTFDYMIQRTLLRPRDAIDFVNTVFGLTDGNTQISAKMVLDAEKIYSERRKAAVFDEWHTEYPKLNLCAQLLLNKTTSFSKDAISEPDLDLLAEKLFDGPMTHDVIEQYVRTAYNGSVDYNFYRNKLINLFFTVGFIGIKTQSTHPVVYSSSNIPTFTVPQITAETKIQIHPMFWWAFGNYKIKGAALDYDLQGN